MGGVLTTMRNYATVAGQAYPPKPTFAVDQIPDLAGSVMIVTGGNTGIGYETCKALLAHDAKVYLAARSREKGHAAIARLKEETGKDAVFLELDLASMKSIKRAAEEFAAKEGALRVLFNNAGVMNPPISALTEEGHDLQWGVNVLGHFYFTELLLPLLAAGAKSSPDHHSRVITTSSSGAYPGKIDFDTFKDSKHRRKVHPELLYFNSKLGNTVVAHQAALRYADMGIISIALNPGNLDSELYRTIPSVGRWIVAKVMLYPNWYGALTQLYAGTMPDALKLNGEFMIPWARPGKCKKEMYDPELGRRVWEWLDGEVKAFEAKL
ncbi:NAD(P)-binding protein [Epithele typhae]|uniref:NAD(P)-binding protein n=1 Tax=Epithele typhae TaxID=378194 RepID=UPI0020072C83|nr:NAD(P)-binding protein [Epithele typhae]KAH9932806.1 NAD(P)-binding protein [Epithele typhae]